MDQNEKTRMSAQFRILIEGPWVSSFLYLKRIYIGKNIFLLIFK